MSYLVWHACHINSLVAKEILLPLWTSLFSLSMVRVTQAKGPRLRSGWIQSTEIEVVIRQFSMIHSSEGTWVKWWNFRFWPESSQDILPCRNTRQRPRQIWHLLACCKSLLSLLHLSHEVSLKRNYYSEEKNIFYSARDQTQSPVHAGQRLCHGSPLTPQRYNAHHIPQPEVRTVYSWRSRIRHFWKLVTFRDIYLFLFQYCVLDSCIKFWNAGSSWLSSVTTRRKNMIF